MINAAELQGCRITDDRAMIQAERFSKKTPIYGWALASPDSVFQQALDMHFDGEQDHRTLDILAKL